ncbi:beta strand repeat-containing protein [Novosphingobium huizhouense]|uniref:beta strand repeat-containing protein n=1 Tax=Novosphingobium huizhouense TaxID=2866625 RepID=UPI001CD83FA0|nr:cadherin-like domain-containing protein [Novosphingobium huizhouense]
MAVSQGDIAFVGINTAGAGSGSDQDWVAFAALKNIAAGEVIYFSDNELTSASSGTFNGSPTGGESYFKWTAPAGGVAAGTVVQIQVLGNQTNAPVASTGTAAWVTSTGSANPGLSSTSDSLYAFTATSDATVGTPSSFLAFINIGNAQDPIPSSLDSKYVISFTDGSDSAYYSGAHSGYPNISDYLAFISNTANWTKQTGNLVYGTNQSASLVATPLGSLSVNSVSVAEGNSGTRTLTFTVTLSSASVQTVTVNYATADGTATAGSDYVAASGTLTFAPGETTKTVAITVNGDLAVEANETFTLQLSNAVNGTISGSTGTGTITNDDLTLQGDDHYTVALGDTLSASSTPVTWNEAVASTPGDGVELTNNGTISSTGGTAIGAVATAPASGDSSFTLYNRGTVSGATNGVAITLASAGTVSILNYDGGLINGTGTRGVDLTATAAGGTFYVGNRAGATIQSANDGVRASFAGTFTGNFTLDNDGTIKTLGAGSGQGVDLGSLNARFFGQVQVNNQGSITGADNDGLRVGNNTIINNYGSITGNSLGATGADGIDLQSASGVEVWNYAGATIDGARHGVTGKLPFGYFGNAGTITAHGGSGLNMDTAGDTVTTIVNEATGTITGTANGLTDGDGIDVDGQVDITNDGLIQTLGHTDGESNEGLAIGGGIVLNNGTIHSAERGIKVDDSNQGNAFGALTLTNHGTITGDSGEAIVIISTFANTIVSDGTINGSVTLGDGGDSFTNTGTLNGAVIGGDGADTIDTGAGADTITGGAGDDTIKAGAGDDTAIFAGNAADSTITRVGTTFTVTGADGVDTVTGVEHFQFADATIEAASINVAPVLTGAKAILVHGTEDTAYTITRAELLAGFTDANADTLSLGSVTSNHGTVTTNADGTYSVALEADYNGAVTLSFTVTDGHGGSTAATTAFVVDPVNDAPVLSGAKAVLVAGNEDQGYTVSASALLQGFTDVDGDTLAVSNLVAGNGTVKDNGNGTYTITPAADFNGTMTLSYSVTDGKDGTIAASSSYTVQAVNDAPVKTGAQAVLADGAEDTPYIVSASDLLAGYGDIDGDSLAVANLVASNGTVKDNGDGTYTITSGADFNGAVTLGYDVTDGVASVAATQSYSLAAVNDAPRNVTIDRATVLENSNPGTLVGTVTADDIDSDELIYNLLSDAGGRFTINTLSGAITVANNAVLDFESTPSLTVTVRVADLYGDFVTKDITIDLVNVVESRAASGTKKADVITATNNDDWTVMGLAGNDILTTLGGNDQVTGGKGNDIISTGAGNDLIIYAKGDDTDSIDAGAGVDTLQVAAGATKLMLSAISGVEIITGSGFVINGTSGGDTLDFSAVTSIAKDVTIDGLGGNDTILGTTLADQIDGGKGNDTVSGGLGDDLLLGRAGDDVLNGGAGNDRIDGGAGNDRIFGGIGSDTLTSGTGKDTFVFSSIADSNAAAGIDHITDYSRKNGDRIDLSQIDANTNLAGDQAFFFIGTAGFYAAGQLRYANVSGHTEVYGDVNGDGVADFTFVIDTPQSVMFPGDFVL